MENKNKVQLIWGIVLILMGVSVFFRLPVVIEKMSDTVDLNSGLYFLHFSFYLIAVILIGGGVKKILNYWPFKR
ncbi:MAG: hypothetical protein J7K96_05125 [Desulfobacteraceae bacterium]|nr:hypothetical protein [Desulfobacteraceae bacterium]